MRTECVVEFIERLKKAGWSVRSNDSIPNALPATVPWFDELHQQFVRQLASCESGGGAVWLLGLDDYAQADGEGWDFLQRQISEDAGLDDPELLSEIRSFWRDHLPIAISAVGDYAYYAISRAGTVVFAVAPELEHTTQVAGSYSAFVQLFSTEIERGAGPLLDRLGVDLKSPHDSD
jgi:hypothetical protein